MEKYLEAINELSPGTIIAVAIVAVILLNTDLSGLLSRFKTRQVPLSDHDMLRQQMRLIRQAACTYDKAERDAVFDAMDEVQRAVERTYVEVDDEVVPTETA